MHYYTFDANIILIAEFYTCGARLGIYRALNNRKVMSSKVYFGHDLGVGFIIECV